jgi:hypothetical protein
MVLNEQIKEFIKSQFIKDDEDKCGLHCYKQWKLNKNINWHLCMSICLSQDK